MPGTAETLDDEAELLRWLEAEHQVLLEAIGQAAREGLIVLATRIFTRLVFNINEGHWSDCDALGDQVLAAAEIADEHAAQGWIHHALGQHCSLRGAADKATAHLAAALDCFERAGDLQGQADAHHSIAHACFWADDFSTAIDHAEKALALYRELEDRSYEGISLCYLSEFNIELGNFDRARGYALQALEVFEETGKITWQAEVRFVLGKLHYKLGEHRVAITSFNQALDMWDQDNPHGRKERASMLTYLGDAQQAVGSRGAAIESWERATLILDSLGLPEADTVRAKLREVVSAVPE